MYIEVYTMFILRQLKVNSYVDLSWDELKHPVINLRTLINFRRKDGTFFLLGRLLVVLMFKIGICLSNPFTPSNKTILAINLNILVPY